MTTYRLVLGGIVTPQRREASSAPPLSLNKGFWAREIDIPPPYNAITHMLAQGAWTVVAPAGGVEGTVAATYTTPLRPVPPVPPVVSRFQARAALLQAGLLDAATAAVEATNDAFTKLAWAEASEWRRESALVVGLATAIGLTSDQIDDLFRAAAQITA